MRIAFAGSVSKDPAFPQHNEDAFAARFQVQKRSPSATVHPSHSIYTWANLLVRRYVQHPRVDAAWVAGAVVEYARGIDRRDLSWSAQGAFDRGTFATLLGIRYSPKRRSVQVVSVGDSLCVLLDGSEVIETIPYVKADEFSQRPTLIATRNLNGFVKAADFRSARRKSLSIRRMVRPALIMVTDALGEWALRQAEAGTPVWADLLAISAARGPRSIGRPRAPRQATACGRHNSRERRLRRLAASGCPTPRSAVQRGPQYPGFSLTDPTFKVATVAKNGWGTPLALAGGFALTYTVSVGGRKYAVRCFHKQSHALEARYLAISRRLRTLRSAYFVDFEFQAQGVRVDGSSFPVVKMAWATGTTMGEFLKGASRPGGTQGSRTP